YAQAREEGIIERLYVFGCLSQRYAEELKAEIPEVDAFYGKFDWHHILEDLGSEYCMEERHRRILTTPAHYAFVKISEGCNRHCAYCAIPLITGRHRSRPMEDIVQEVKELVAGGVKEVQLIAQDLSYYGKDLYGRFNLAELMEKLSDIEGLEWLRLHYTYPHLFPMDILKVMRERKNICHYLDMAFQHCSDHMLQQMRRHINAEESYQLIEAIRKEVPDIHLRTTLMVGHPGEMEEDFEALKTFVQKVRFERMGAFSFSSEEGTYSGDHYQDDVAQEVKEARLDELMALQHNISEEINQEKVGKCLKVIIDREEEDYYIARSEFDSPEVDPEIFIDKTKKLNIGSFYQARITQADTYDLFAKIVENQ
ncbi:MAG: 30S ribosomal protein S12 methylthiotransferase RimO, partial [Bacteroidales bacterium]|nr:30S ribosomal protein S12 methylthiotransferase RimO [Bacteroidales bacterium]